MAGFRGKREAESESDASFAFRGVSGLGGSHSGPAARKLTDAYSQLHKANATYAADRIKGIDAQVGKVDFPILMTLVNLERAADEVASALQRPVQRWHAWRNTLALAPLLLTWLALGFASLAYSHELASHPALSTKPFLLLWEQGFGGSFPSFLDVALTDFLFLAIVFALTIRVHQEEGKAAKRESAILDTLFPAIDLLEVAVKESTPQTPGSVQERATVSRQWAEKVGLIIQDAMREAHELARTSQEQVRMATGQLATIQRRGLEAMEATQQQSRAHMEAFAAGVKQVQETTRETLVAVREENQQFISRTAEETRETLKLLVEEQMDPLLKQLTGMLSEFGRHQETYRSGVADLSRGVTGIRDAARDLTSSAQASGQTMDALAASLDGLETSQANFAARVANTADSMEIAATAIKEFRDSMAEMHQSTDQLARTVTIASGDVQRTLSDMHDAVQQPLTELHDAVLHAVADMRGAAAQPLTDMHVTVQQAVTEMRDAIRQMTDDMTSAGTNLRDVQLQLAATSGSLLSTSDSLDETAESFRGTIRALGKVSDELREIKLARRRRFFSKRDG